MCIDKCGFVDDILKLKFKSPVDYIQDICFPRQAKDSMSSCQYLSFQDVNTGDGSEVLSSGWRWVVIYKTLRSCQEV